MLEEFTIFRSVNKFISCSTTLCISGCLLTCILFYLSIWDKMQELLQLLYLLGSKLLLLLFLLLFRHFGNNQQNGKVEKRFLVTTLL